MTAASSRLAILLAALLVLPAAVSAAGACGNGLPLRAAGHGYTVAFAPQPAKIVVGQHFKLDVAVCAEPGRLAATALKVDADMPAHRHGMNYRASLKGTGEQRWLAEGLMFHMPGRWRFLFELATPQGVRKLSHEVEVE